MIDLPWKYLGSKHRILFHTPEEAMLMGMTIDGVKGAIGGRMHVEIDRAASADKNLKALLEAWAQTPIPKPGVLLVSLEGLPRAKKAKARIILSS